MAITDMWWATTSCSSRAMRWRSSSSARSPSWRRSATASCSRLLRRNRTMTPPRTTATVRMTADQQVGQDDGERRSRPCGEREAVPEEERRAEDEGDQQDLRRAVMVAVLGGLIPDGGVREAEGDDRDERVGDLHQVEPPTPQPARARRRWRRDTGREPGPDRARRTSTHVFRVGPARRGFRAPSGVSAGPYPGRGWFAGRRGRTGATAAAG